MQSEFEPPFGDCDNRNCTSSEEVENFSLSPSSHPLVCPIVGTRDGLPTLPLNLQSKSNQSILSFLHYSTTSPAAQHAQGLHDQACMINMYEQLLHSSLSPSVTIPSLPSEAVPIQLHYPAFSLCTTAAEFNDVARSFVETTHITDAIAHADMLISTGGGIPIQLAAQHLACANDIGLLGMIRQLHESLGPRTIQPNLPPASRLVVPLLPIRPKPSLRSPSTNYINGTPTMNDMCTSTSNSNSVSNAVSSHFLDPLFTTTSMSDIEKRNYIALNGLPIRIPDGFVPNNGVGVRPYPPSIAPPSVIQVHIAKLLAAGKGILLPLADAQRLCAQEGLLLHVSTSFLQEKLNSILMRFIIDYTNSSGPGACCSINHPSKSADLAATWTTIKHPGPADICQIYLNASAVYGDVPLYGVRLDIDDAYPRLKLAPTSVSLCAVLVVVNECYFVYFPAVCTFGIQDVNFAFHLITTDIDTQAQARDAVVHSCQLSTGYTDDFLSFRSEVALPDFIAAVTNDVDSRVAEEAISSNKTLQGLRLPMIGFDINTTTSSIGVLEKHFATVWHYLFNIIPCNIYPGYLIDYKVVESLSSHMMRLANLIPPLLPFSRGLSANMRGVHHLSPTISLNQRSVTDIWMWRATFHGAIFRRPLVIGTYDSAVPVSSTT